MATSTLFQSRALPLGQFVKVRGRSTAPSHTSVIITVHIILFVFLCLNVNLIFIFVFLFDLFFFVTSLHGFFLCNLTLQLTQFLVIADQLNFSRLNCYGATFRWLSSHYGLSTSSFGDLDRRWRGCNIDIHIAISIGVSLFILFTIHILVIFFIFLFLFIIYNIVHLLILIIVFTVRFHDVAFLDMSWSLPLDDLAPDKLLSAPARASGLSQFARWSFNGKTH